MHKCVRTAQQTNAPASRQPTTCDWCSEGGPQAGKRCAGGRHGTCCQPVHHSPAGHPQGALGCAATAGACSAGVTLSVTLGACCVASEHMSMCIHSAAGHHSRPAGTIQACEWYLVPCAGAHAAQWRCETHARAVQVWEAGAAAGAGCHARRQARAAQGRRPVPVRPPPRLFLPRVLAVLCFTVLVLVVAIAAHALAYCPAPAHAVLRHCSCYGSMSHRRVWPVLLLLQTVPDGMAS